MTSTPDVLKARLYGIVDLGYITPDEAPASLDAMLDGGVGIVQLRAKGILPAELAGLARVLFAKAGARGVPFVVNDHPELAGPPFSHGIHIGQDDGEIAEIRRAIPNGCLVGKSTHSIEQALRASADGADYIGFGPLFATPTKPDSTPVGLGGVAEVQRLVQCPVFCIGGIKLENLERVIAAGARRVVIVSGLLQAGDTAGYCRSALALLERGAP